jgi:hypothetical protein
MAPGMENGKAVHVDVVVDVVVHLDVDGFMYRKRPDVILGHSKLHGTI